MSAREERIGKNEALFREVNDRVEDLSTEFGVEDEPLELLCECGSVECVERIRMSTPEYRELRSDATRFAIVPGHDEPSVERVVERRDGYDVVQKLPGEPTRVAAETDPHS